MSWAGGGALVAFALVLGYVLGGTRVTTRHEQLVAWTINENRQLASALRALYEATGYQFPEFALDPEPAQGRWTRFIDWMRTVPEEDWDEEYEDQEPEPVKGPATAPAIEVAAGQVDAWRARFTFTPDEPYSGPRARSQVPIHQAAEGLRGATTQGEVEDRGSEDQQRHGG